MKFLVLLLPLMAYADLINTSKPEEILQTLSSPHTELKNNYCLAYNIRNNDTLDLKIAAGYHISSLAFEKHSVLTENGLKYLMNVVAKYKHTNGTILGETLEFDCTMADQ